MGKRQVCNGSAHIALSNQSMLPYSLAMVYSTVYIEFSFFCADFHSLSFLLWLLLPKKGKRWNKKLQTEGSVGVRGFMCALVSKLWPEKRYLR